MTDCADKKKHSWFNRWLNYCHTDSGPSHIGWIIYKAIAKPQRARLLIDGAEHCICCRDTRMGLYGFAVGMALGVPLGVVISIL